MIPIDLGPGDNQIFVQPQEGGGTKIVWYLRDFDKYWAKPDTPGTPSLVKSEKFRTPDNGQWKLIIAPNGSPDSPEFVSLYIKAIRNKRIGENKVMLREVNFRAHYYKDNKLGGLVKDRQTFTLNDPEWGFKEFISKSMMIENKFNNHFFIELLIVSTIDYDKLVESDSSLIRSTNGIKNAGTTCYLN